MTSMEKMHSDATGVTMDGRPEWPWLNSYETVSKIVRGFAADIVRDFGVVGFSDFADNLHDMALEMNRLFIGAGSAQFRYRRSVWNTPEQLGQHILIEMQISGEIRFGVRDAFYVFTGKLTDILAANVGKPIEEFGPEMDDLCDEMTRNLLGLPSQDE